MNDLPEALKPMVKGGGFGSRCGHHDSIVKRSVATESLHGGGNRRRFLADSHIYGKH